MLNLFKIVHKQTLLLIILLLDIFTYSAYSQTYVHPIEQVDPTVAPFLIERGDDDPGYTGDLDLKVPLLTVPGRGGLDYKIDLQYIDGNGVPACESPSWVGLGWNLNQYQITCNPTYDVSTGMNDSDFNPIYLNRVKTEQPDLYYLNFPGGSTPIRKFGNEWYPLRWSALKIEASPVASESDANFTISNDYNRFIITDQHGVKYVFGTALKKKSNKTLLNHRPSFVSHTMNSYYYVFKLSAILGNNYIDGGGDGYTPGDGGNDRGNWIKITYHNNEVIHMDAGNSQYMEVNYIDRIITPTHEAVFNLNYEKIIQLIFGGQEPSESNCAYALDNIQLFNKNNQIIKTVSFTTSYKFSWVECESSGYYLNNSDLRLGLDEVTITGNNQESLPPYKFSYNGNPAINFDTLPSNSYGTDAWGLFTVQRNIPYPDENLANLNSCWMLKTVTYPTGAIDTFYYESDRYQSYLYTSRGNGINNSGIHAGGIRLKSKVTWNPTDNSILREYYKYAQSNELLPGFGFISCEPSIFNTVLFDNDVAQDYNTEVHYPDVCIIRADGSKIKRYYTSAFSNIQTSQPKAWSAYCYDYSSYIKSYENVTNITDSVIYNANSFYNIGFFKSRDFGKLNGELITDPTPLQEQDMELCKEIYRNESLEYDDEPLRVTHIPDIDFDVTLKLFDNSWKRGCLLREEIWGPGDMTESPIPTLVTNYFYTMKPVKTEAYFVHYFVYTGTVESVLGFATAGWAQLNGIQTIRNLDPLKYISYTYNEKNGLVEKETIKDYPDAEANYKSVYTAYAYSANTGMDQKHMLSQKLFTVTGNEESSFSPILNSNLNIASITGTVWALFDDQWYPHKEYVWNDNDGNGDFNSSEDMILKEFDYDDFGNPIEIKDANGIYTSVRMGHNSSVPICITRNSKRTENLYDGFEDGTERQWLPFSSGGTMSNTSYTGYLGYHFQNGVTESITRQITASEINPTGRYIFSAWVKSSSTQASLKCVVTFNGTTTSEAGLVSSAGSGEWEYIELPLDLSDYPNIAEINLIAMNYNSGSGMSCDFDDLRFLPLGSSMVTYTYDPVTLNLKSESDPNNRPVKYTYDGLQRLTHVRDCSDQVLEEYNYSYPGSLISLTNPNKLETRTYRSDDDYSLIKKYNDGLGRLVQIQTVTENGNIAAHNTYDQLGRAARKYTPYRIYQDSFDPEANIESNASDYYEYDYPYSETEYEHDGKIKTIKYEGVTYHNAHNIRYTYNTASDVSPTRMYEVITITDENNVITDEYYDKYGNKIKQIKGRLGLNLETEFEYNLSGNLTKSTPPKGEAYSSYYSYNTIGQLTEKTTPDAGTVKYIYDEAGNLRFIRDANQSADSGKFTYNKYDALNRLIESGEYTVSGNFTQANADSNDFPLPTDENKELNQQLYYDSPYDDNAQNNLKGRISKSISYRQGEAVCTTYYSYDAYGRAEWLLHKMPGLSDKKISYWYDRQGNVIKKSVSDLGNNTLYTFYKYDMAGRLKEVYTSSVDNQITWIKEAEYVYNADGSVKRLELGENTQGLDYSYNERGWLTQINHQNLDGLYNNEPQDPGRDGYDSGFASDKFSEVIGYNNLYHIGEERFGFNCQPQYNGNISWAISRTKGVALVNGATADPEPIIGYVYGYDNVNRLTKADFGYWKTETGEWVNHQMYDLPLIKYDANGNIDTLKRNGYDGSLKDNFGYHYESGTNKLQSISGSENENYLYDCNGNVTRDGFRDIEITYNEKNLPEDIYEFEQDDYISYTYDASGKRIRKRIGLAGSLDEIYVLGADGQTEAVFDANGSPKFFNIIAGSENLGRVEPTASDLRITNITLSGIKTGNNIIAENNVLVTSSATLKAGTKITLKQGFRAAEGCTFNGLIDSTLANTPERFYYVKDHLGSTRVTVDKNGDVVSYDDYDPWGMQLDYRNSNFGMANEKYKFTGKERDNETKYDYFGARYYDSRIGRWLQVDPLADKYPETSSYIYCFNNPLVIIDPNGMDSTKTNSNTNIPNIDPLPLVQIQTKTLVNSLINGTLDGVDKLSETVSDFSTIGIIALGVTGTVYPPAWAGIPYLTALNTTADVTSTVTKLGKYYQGTVEAEEVAYKAAETSIDLIAGKAVSNFNPVKEISFVRKGRIISQFQIAGKFVSAQQANTMNAIYKTTVAEPVSLSVPIILNSVKKK